MAQSGWHIKWTSQCGRNLLEIIFLLNLRCWHQARSHSNPWSFVMIIFSTQALNCACCLSAQRPIVLSSAENKFVGVSKWQLTNVIQWGMGVGSIFNITTISLNPPYCSSICSPPGSRGTWYSEFFCEEISCCSALLVFVLGFGSIRSAIKMTTSPSTFQPSKCHHFDVSLLLLNLVDFAIPKN